MIKDRILIVDGYNLFVRHYVAHPAMSDNGDQIGGIVGFFNNIIRLIERCKPEEVIVVWEGGGSKRKRDLYSDYKMSKRPQKLNRYYDQDIPDSYKNRNYQLVTLINLLSCFPVNQIYIEESEADDVIGYLVKYKLKQKNIIIVSSDHDYYQLISKNTIIWSPTLKAFVNNKKVLQRFKIHPKNFCLAKSISGDNSDNIPGVKGVSYKTLSKYFPKFSNPDDYLFDCFVNDVEQLKTNKKLKILNTLSCTKNQDMIKRNLKLVLLDVNNLSHYQVNKINEKIENYKKITDNMKAHKLLKDNAISSLDLLRCNFIFKTIKRQNK